MLQRFVDMSFGREGTLIATLLVYVEFEMWLAFLHASKLLLNTCVCLAAYAFQCLFRLQTRSLFRQGFPVSFSLSVAIADDVRFWSSCEIVDIHLVLQPSKMNLVSVEAVLVVVEVVVVVIVVVVIVVHCLDNAWTMSNRVHNFMFSIVHPLCVFKTFQDSTQNSSPFHHICSSFVFVSISFLSQSSS